MSNTNSILLNFSVLYMYCIYSLNEFVLLLSSYMQTEMTSTCIKLYYNNENRSLRQTNKKFVV